MTHGPLFFVFLLFLHTSPWSLLWQSPEPDVAVRQFSIVQVDCNKYLGTMYNILNRMTENAFVSKGASEWNFYLLLKVELTVQTVNGQVIEQYCSILTVWHCKGKFSHLISL